MTKDCLLGGPGMRNRDRKENTCFLLKNILIVTGSIWTEKNVKNIQIAILIVAPVQNNFLFPRGNHYPDYYYYFLFVISISIHASLYNIVKFCLFWKFI